jgi:hypothetical protein
MEKSECYSKFPRTEAEAFIALEAHLHVARKMVTRRDEYSVDMVRSDHK